MINLVFGKSTLLTVTFRTFNDDNDVGGPADPDIVKVYIRKGPAGSPDDIGDAQESDFLNSGEILYEYTYDPLDNTIERSSMGVYSFTLRTGNSFGDIGLGAFVVEFDGFWVIDNSHDITSELFEVTLDQENFFLGNKLGEDQFLWFMPTLDHAYVDVEDILLVFPDASPIDAIDFIHLYSQEVDQIMSLTSVGSDTTKWDVVLFDYIRAATLCSLSKLYGFGDADLTQITLGDLNVTNQRFGRTMINRSTATTWCELAGALREELMRNSGRNNMRSIVKGSSYGNPIPERRLKPYERGRF